MTNNENYERVSVPLRGFLFLTGPNIYIDTNAKEVVSVPLRGFLFLTLIFYLVLTMLILSFRPLTGIFVFNLKAEYGIDY